MSLDWVGVERPISERPHGSRFKATVWKRPGVDLSGDCPFGQVQRASIDLPSVAECGASQDIFMDRNPDIRQRSVRRESEQWRLLRTVHPTGGASASREFLNQHVSEL